MYTQMLAFCLLGRSKGLVLVVMFIFYFATRSLVVPSYQWLSRDVCEVC